MRILLILLCLQSFAYADPSLNRYFNAAQSRAQLVARYDSMTYEDIKLSKHSKQPLGLMWSASICVSRKRLYELDRQIQEDGSSPNLLAAIKYHTAVIRENLKALKQWPYIQQGCRDPEVEHFVCDRQFSPLTTCTMHSDVPVGPNEHVYTFWSPLYDADDEEERQQYIPQHPNINPNPPCVDDLCVEITLQ